MKEVADTAHAVSSFTDLGIDIRLVAALIGFLAFAVSQALNAFFVSLRDRSQATIEKKDIARFSRAELINIRRHNEANLIKLKSTLESDGYGEEIDYEKMKLSDNGLVALDLSKIYVLEQDLTQDLLRFSLFCRNNELEIKNAFSVVTGNNNDASKRECLNSLKSRFETTVAKSNEISERLASFEQSPKRYRTNGVQWPDALFKLRK